MITGNTQVDYVLTVLFALAKNVLHHAYYSTQLLLVHYPDLSLILIALVSCVVLYYFVKNAVRIIYGIIVTTIKLCLLLSLVLTGTWIYFRGLDSWTDFMRVVDYAGGIDWNTTTFESYWQRAQAVWHLSS